MAGLDSRHVTWGHLQYYDTQIKKFVEDAVAVLDNSTVKPEETNEIKQRLTDVETLATVNRANIESIVVVNKEQNTKLETLFTYNTTNTQNIARLQENVFALASKEDLATQTARIDAIREDLTRLEVALDTDHKSIENIRVALESKASKADVENAIKNIPQISLANYFTKDEVLQLIPNVEHLATKEELAIVDGKINTALDDIKELEDETETDHKTIEEIQLALTGNYYTKDEVEDLLPDTSAFVTTPELEAAIDNCATEAEVTSLIQEIADVQEQLDEKANVEDIPSIQGLATEEFVVKKIAEAELADQDVDLSAYYTKSETDVAIKTAVNSIDIPDVSNLATKEELEAVQNVAGSNSVKLFAIESDLVDINQKLDSIETPDLSDYATKDEVAAVEAKVDAIVIPEVPTKVSELENDAGYLTEHQDISGKADKSDLVGLATESYVDTAIENIPEVDLSDYATQQFVLDKIAEVPTDYLKEVPSEYITESELSEELAKIEHPTVDLEGYATEDWVNEQGFLKEHQDLSEYAKKSELPTDYLTSSDIENKAEKSELNALGDRVNDLITTVDNKANTSDLAPLATKQELEEYAKKSDIPSDYVTTEQLDTKADKSDLDGVATQEWVTAELAKIDPSIPSEYITETELEEKGYITESALSSYAKIEDIPTDYLTSSDIENKVDRSELEDYAKKSDIPNIEGLATKNELSEVENKIPSIDDLASTDYVDQAIANIPETDVSNLATKSELEAVEAKIPTNYLTSIPDEYITKQELDAEGFVKSLDGYATEQFVTDAISNIKHPDPDLSNYYTKDETTSAINEAIDGIEIPEVDLEPYATKAQVAEQVAVKADNVPFTTDMRVNTALGGFLQDESLQNMTIAQILTKLLNLIEYTPPVTPEGILEGTPAAAVSLITNEVPSYMLSNSGDIVVNPYNYRVMTIVEGAEDNQEESFLYQIIDDNNTAVETGYHITTEFLDEGYLTVLIPTTVSDFEVKVYDAIAGNWTAPMWTLIENSDYTKDGYIAYTADPSFEIYEGIAIRIVIK